MGLYYMTICTFQRKQILGRIVYDPNARYPHAVFIPSPLGEACDRALVSVDERMDAVEVVKCTLMPDHLHLLVRIASPESASLGEVVFAFKRHVTGFVRRSGIEGKIWQKSYYDHIVRSDEDVVRIVEYMERNPLRWVLKQKGLA